MNNLDIILRKIGEDAKSRADAILAKAGEEAAAISASAGDAATQAAEAAKAQCNKECSQILSRAESAAAMRRREILLSVKVQKIEEAYRRAEAELYGLNSKDYTALLARLLAEAMLERLRAVDSLTALYGETESAEPPVFEAVFNERDKDAVGNAVVSAAAKLLAKAEPRFAGVKASVSGQTAAIRGGLIVRYGDIESNCSFQTLIAAARDTCDASVVKTLFPA